MAARRQNKIQTAEHGAFTRSLPNLMVSQPQELRQLMVETGVRDAFHRLKRHRSVVWEQFSTQSDAYFPKCHYGRAKTRKRMLFSVSIEEALAEQQLQYFFVIRADTPAEPQHIDIVFQRMRKKIHGIIMLTEYIASTRDLGKPLSYFLYKEKLPLHKLRTSERAKAAASITGSIEELINKIFESYLDSLAKLEPEIITPSKDMILTPEEVCKTMAEDGVRDAFKRYADMQKASWPPYSNYHQINIPEYNDGNLIFRAAVCMVQPDYAAVVSAYPLRHSLLTDMTKYVEDIMFEMNDNGNHPVSLVFSYAATAHDVGYTVPLLSVSIPFPAADFENGYRSDIGPKVRDKVIGMIEKLSAAGRAKLR